MIEAVMPLLAVLALAAVFGLAGWIVLRRGR